jgi:hypothetical protein
MNTNNYDIVGDIDIKQLYLIPGRTDAPAFIDLKEFLVELNIYESIFTPFVTGNLILSDSLNLGKVLPLLGEELLIVQLLTPNIDEKFAIYKTFKINSLKEKIYTENGSTQVYRLNFSSAEMIADLLSPINSAFTGKPHELVRRIYSDYLATTRNLNVKLIKTSTNNTTEAKLERIDDSSPLTILTETTNLVTFVSPGWSPINCINWLSSKSQAPNNGPNNFLFWETTKGFYFGTFSDVFSEPNKFSIGRYTQNTVSEGTGTDNLQNRVFNIKTSIVKQNFDQVENILKGYTSSRVIDVNLFNKTYTNYDYDHIQGFIFDYPHTNGEQSLPIYSADTIRNPNSYKVLNYNYPKLFNSSDNNFSEIFKTIYGNRRSNLLELTNFKKEITIVGRTDIEVGTLIEIDIFENKVSGDATMSEKDDLYSGYYLITGINHKVNLSKHFITMEITKDSIFGK